ncbi:ABC transporter substrate-binding protein [Amphibiibacter pelophylacis]|uniref:ABC transporter substrate-binding protein n=1 Tax=Amphibiibacter pelophylacis TaxID=1799477 RepID=A0ACC6P3X7_9BURK
MSDCARPISRRQALTTTARGLLGSYTALAGLSFATQAHADTPKDTLVVAFAFDDVITLDPAESFEISTAEFLGNAYSRLVRLDRKDTSRVKPDAALSWTVGADGKTYTFNIRPGIKFASGNPLTAADVAWSLQRAVLLNKSPAFILNQFGWTKDTVKDRITATSPMVLTLVTDQTYAPSLVLNCLTSTVGAVVDSKLLQSQAQGEDMGNTWLKTHYAGSGPFRIRDWRANEILVLERNDGWHGGRPKLARVIFRHIKESSTQRLLLEKGDVDVVRNLTPQDLEAIASNPQIQTTSATKGTVYYIALNQKNPILAQPEVREAMKWLVDYDGIGKTLIRGIGTIHQQFLPKGILGASEAKPFRLDVDKAKALLAKAGHPDGFPITLDVRTIQPNQGIAEAFQQTAKRAGVDIRLVPGDGKQVLTRMRARAHDMIISNWGVDYWDPNSNADTFTSNPDNSDGAANKTLAWRSAWDIPELTRQTKAAALERDSARRKALYGKLQAEFTRSSPFVMLYQTVEVAAFRKGLQGFSLGPSMETNELDPVAK